MASIVCVEKHHQVLPIWAEYRRQVRAAPRLITLDHHTDTSAPFRNFLKAYFPDQPDQHERLRTEWLKVLDFQNPVSVNQAVERLSNDEHVVTALSTDIISTAFVIAHNAQDTDAETFREHRIICRAVNPLANVIPREDCDRVLESDFLDERFASMNALLLELGDKDLFAVPSATPYILDIDLDYFNTFQSFSPKSATSFQNLVRGAALVTIATEPDYVKSCALDRELTFDQVLHGLRQII